ncbi:hypothetical protein RB195_002971 [Necator americanus]|uniref:Mos1 transposase HTH domain-containing protein n=1 Tax=Necator americanus TaxID=51031 RepID=A0ABR1DMT3_NECAM
MAKFNGVTLEQMKYLVWICGFVTPQDAGVRAHALCKMEDNPQATLKAYRRSSALYQHSSKDCSNRLPQMEPPVKRRNTLQKAHPGQTRKTKMLARSFVNWPTMDSEIEKLVKTCPRRASVGKDPIKAELESTTRITVMAETILAVDSSPCWFRWTDGKTILSVYRGHENFYSSVN